MSYVDTLLAEAKAKVNSYTIMENLSNRINSSMDGLVSLTQYTNLKKSISKERKLANQFFSDSEYWDDYRTRKYLDTALHLDEQVDKKEKKIKELNLKAKGIRRLRKIILEQCG